MTESNKADAMTELTDADHLRHQLFTVQLLAQSAKLFIENCPGAPPGTFSAICLEEFTGMLVREYGPDETKSMFLQGVDEYVAQAAQEDVK